METVPQEKRWAWFQQLVDAVVVVLGIGIAVVMTYRNSFPPLAVMLFTSCVGKVTASQLIKQLLGRWDAKP